MMNMQPPTSATMDYSRKPRRYFQSLRTDFLDALPENPEGAILEIGCGSGELGAAALEADKCATYCGIEIDPSAAAEARLRLTEVVEGDLESLTLDWPDGRFNALIASEVLEHLKDPWAALMRLRRLLAPGALVLASSPNVAHWRVIRMLLRGRWDLTDTGVMDRTHLRWFTPRTYAALFADSGFEVLSCRPVRAPGPRGRLLSALTLGRCEHLSWTQIAITARVPIDVTTADRTV